MDEDSLVAESVLFDNIIYMGRAVIGKKCISLKKIGCSKSLHISYRHYMYIVQMECQTISLSTYYSFLGYESNYRAV